MKKFKITGFILSILLLAGISFADVNFSGMAGGSTGVSGITGDNPDFTIPFNAFAAAQLNLGSWGIFRANLGLASKNLIGGNLFTGQDATLKMNEVSLVLTKSGNAIKNYFGFYFGTYEVVGQDEFLQRQFGIEPFTSMVTRNATTLSTGIPLYDNYGTGFSYIMNFADAPGVLGFNFYINETSAKIFKINLDIRTAWITKLLTIDLCGGLGVPIQNQGTETEILLLIDTLYAHGGVSLLLGNRYTHSLFIQAGIQNLELIKGSSPSSFEGIDDLSLLVEARIYSKEFKTRVTAYSLHKETIKDMFYLQDTLGVVLSLYSDTIPVKNNNMTMGTYIIGSLSDQSLADVISTTAFATIPKINVYLTPFVSIPVADGEMELMGQLGGLDIVNNLHFSFQAKIGYKKTF